MEPKIALKVAAALVGSTVELCAKLQITRQALYKWRTAGVPLKRAVQIERITEGKVRAVDLCPGEFNDNKPDSQKQSPSV